MKIALFGGSGLVGSYVQKEFETRLFLRGKPGSAPWVWDPYANLLNPQDLEGVDVIVNLSGDNIATGRWTSQKRRSIYESRIRTTTLLAETILKMEKPPRHWIQASAIGYYGKHREEAVYEEDERGKTFLSNVCQKWEEVALKGEARTRLSFFRFGVVLSKKGGALKKMLPLFRLGLGGTLGSGKQWMSWVLAEEIPHIIRHVVEQHLAGPINIVSPNPTTNADFTQALGEVLHRPTFLPAPEWALKGIFGEMAEEVLLSNLKVRPKVLLDSGYSFHFPEILSALQHALKE